MDLTKVDLHNLTPEQFEEYFEHVKANPEKYCQAHIKYHTQVSKFRKKLEWLKLYDQIELKAKLADKYAVRNYVADTLSYYINRKGHPKYFGKQQRGHDFLMPLLGRWNNADEIDFDKLPRPFILKCNHGSGMNLIFNPDPLDREDKVMTLDHVRRVFNHMLQSDFSRKTEEIHYSLIPRCIIAEEYKGKLLSYFIKCFNGKVKTVTIVNIPDTSVGEYNFDREFNELPITYNHAKRASYPIEKPANWQRLIEVAEALCAQFKFVRCDLYALENGDIKFSEMTFTPASMEFTVQPPEWEERLDQWLKETDIPVD